MNPTHSTAVSHLTPPPGPPSAKGANPEDSLKQGDWIRLYYTCTRADDENRLADDEPKYGGLPVRVSSARPNNLSIMSAEGAVHQFAVRGPFWSHRIEKVGRVQRALLDLRHPRPDRLAPSG